MTLKIEANTRTERNIAPPMPLSITLPLIVDGVDARFVLYLTHNAFTDQSPTATELREVAVAVIDRFTH